LDVRKGLVFLIISSCLFCCRKESSRLYTIGIIQIIESPTVSEVHKGFMQALHDQGLQEGRDIRLIVRNGGGDISEVQRIAQEFVREKVDLIIAHSTPSLQAALIATQKIPIVFTSIANPYRAGAGKSAEDHLSNVSGVASTGPVAQTLAFVKQVLPQIRRIGTLWTPAELNSEYYLELARAAAADLGMEVVVVPVSSASEVLIAAQILVNKKIDAIYQISDNTTNAAFASLGRVASENGIPLFGGFLLSAQMGACAAMGWDFYDMGYKTGQIAVRVKDGESPGRIPILSMSDIKLYLHLGAARRQGVRFDDSVLKKADQVFEQEAATEGPSFPR
jgi:putative ABC transport system substrate-binding protein